MRRILPWLLLVLVIGLGLGFFSQNLLSFDFQTEKQVEEEATVLLEKIETVTKLITVEGNLSELYNYKDYYGYDWWIFRKRAILRVKGRVSVGYDLSNIKVATFPDERRIRITNIPVEPEILSIDHEVDYYDLSEGTFNTFSEEDYSKLNENAKDLLASKARESELMDMAREQGNEIFNLIQFIGENAGWQVELFGIDNAPVLAD